jgi:hypothetical protein
MNLKHTLHIHEYILHFGFIWENCISKEIFYTYCILNIYPYLWAIENDQLQIKIGQ